MRKNKTEETPQHVDEFIQQVENEQKRSDSYRLIEMMSAATGFEPKMWGPSIIGFGRYHYTYASGQWGDAPLLGFSPRKAAISLYVFTGLAEHEHLLEGLGKFSRGKACIYAKKLSDIDERVLENLMRTTIEFLKEKYGN